ncbi:TIGR00645 family protein [Falsiroseomonas oryzae]|uniref:TIGR00645 family protein n=1 Tax=Falsiroseomonas oryzae TaxID=2766473 RepID=UPI0022EB22BC|nr:TIGR00645 family protein [Roseomonas sp. MO-31]
MQAILDKVILGSRWILAVFFLGLAAALVIYAVHFLAKLWKFAAGALAGDATQLLIDLLHLLDSALVASLVVMVAISSYDSLVSRLTNDEQERKASWVSTIDPGNLKIKLSTALIAISSIHLLQIFMDVREYDDRAIMWAVVIHTMFLLGAIALGLLDRLTALSKKGKP